MLKTLTFCVGAGALLLSGNAYAADDAQLDAALAAVKAEPKVISAAWNSRGMPSLLAGVMDDGSNRDGYAQYLCMLLADNGIKGGVVRVLDVASDDWVELGKAVCR